MMATSPVPKTPAFRKLRGYAFDPSLSLQLDTATINEIVYQVPWETLDAGNGCLSGEYLEIVDHDPTISRSYAVADLNHPHVLAADGLDPSEANPQFHQQMVYAVAMTTIRNFEIGLGRKVIWAPQRPEKGQDIYVQRLRIYPHALREANAFYSPQKKALLFGYFEATPADRSKHMPGSLVFTCLSHDIIAHETTHAILDGMFHYYNEPTNPDMLAFHEAFADIIALFQHFTFAEVLRHQISLTRGNLEGQNLLGQLAQQFGSAIGGYGSLRDAIGQIDEKTKTWKPTVPDPTDYETVMEPHKRGSILVAAVFDAFLAIYRRQVADLLRIASGGSGLLGEGELHPDLVKRLSQEAAKCSRRVLHMCIRALDYCPPVDLTFGEYLRAIITADMDVKGEAQQEYHLAFIDAFRRRGIYPKGIKTMSVDGLCHPHVALSGATDQLLSIIGEFLREYRREVQFVSAREEVHKISTDFLKGTKGLHNRLVSKTGVSADLQKITGMAWNNWGAVGVADNRNRRTGGPRIAVHNLRVATRTGPDGDPVNNIIFSMVQRAGVMVKAGGVTPVVLKDGELEDDETMIFRGGCTFVYDLDTLRLKYVITKPLVTSSGGLDEDRVRGQHDYQTEDGPSSMSEFHHYFGSSFARSIGEPFAFLHQH